MIETDPKIAIVILNYNGKNDTLECLKSLSKINNIEQCQIIVVDNNSNDSSVQSLKKFVSQEKKLPIILIENKENFGFASGNNIGIKKALEEGVDYILLLNNDTLVDKNILVKLLESAKSQTKAGIIGPKIYFAPGCEYHHDRYAKNERGKVIWYAGGQIDWNNIICSHRRVDEVNHGQFDQASETDFVSGCAFFVKREVLEKVGLFDPNYYLYLEDVDLCQRAKKAGYSLWFEPKAYLWHKNANSSGKPGSLLHVYYQTRNRLLFGFKYAGWKTKFALLRESLRQLLTDKTKRQAILDFYLGHLGRSYSV